MSSMSRVLGFDLDEASMIAVDGVSPPVDAEVDRMVCVRGMSRGAGRGRFEFGAFGDGLGDDPEPSWPCGMASGAAEEPLGAAFLSAPLRGTYLVGALEIDAPVPFPFPDARPSPLEGAEPPTSLVPSTARLSPAESASCSAESPFPFLETFLELV